MGALLFTLPALFARENLGRLTGNVKLSLMPARRLAGSVRQERRGGNVSPRQEHRDGNVSLRQEHQDGNVSPRQEHQDGSERLNLVE